MNRDQIQSLLLGLILIILVMASYDKYQSKLISRELKIDESSRAPNSKNHLERVNQHMLTASEEARIAREKIELELSQIRQTPSSRARTMVSPTPQSLNYDVQENPVKKEIGRGEQDDPIPHSPTELIQEEILYQQAEHKNQQKFLDQYYERVIQRAREQGWDLTLNPDGTIRSMKKRSQPSNSLNDQDFQAPASIESGPRR